MTPGREDLLIERGSGFQRTFTYLQPDGTPIDLSTWHAVASFSKSMDSPIPLLQINEGSGDIQMNAHGVITLNLSASQTLDIDVDFTCIFGAFPGKGTSKIPPGAFNGYLLGWDLKLFPPLADPFTLLAGVACFTHSPSSSTLTT